MQEALKHLMIMHRGGYFMLERIEYRWRIREATILHPNEVMFMCRNQFDGDLIILIAL